jgi:hypothetical protein
MRPMDLPPRSHREHRSKCATQLRLCEEIWRDLRMKLVGPLAARSPGLRLTLALEIERYCSADEIL